MKNILVEYKGGGYSGCIWEWNYCLVDKKGNFHDIYSSGIDGINDVATLAGYLQTMENKKDFYIYNFSNKADLKDFADNSAIQNVLMVAKWLGEKDFLSENIISGSEIPLICSCCGSDTDYDEIDVTEGDYRGDGGIGIQYMSITCYNCVSMYSCSYCDEYMGEDEPLRDGYCEYCEEEIKREREKAEF